MPAGSVESIERRLLELEGLHRECRVDLAGQLARIESELTVLRERVTHLRILLVLIAIAAGAAPIAAALGCIQKVSPTVTAEPEIRSSGASSSTGVGWSGRAETIIGTIERGPSWPAYAGGASTAVATAAAAIAILRLRIARTAALRMMTAIERTNAKAAKAIVAGLGRASDDKAEQWIRRMKGRS